MNATEDRIRDAFRADAETVRPGSLRGLPDPGTRPAPRRRPARMSARRVLVPLAAAAAVTAIAVAASVLVPHAGRPSMPQAGGQIMPAAVGRALAGPGAAVAPPRFFVGTNGYNAEVYNARTGKIVARIASPKGTSIEDSAATGNDRTYVIAAVSRAACETFFYQARLTAQGRVASMTPLSVPRVAGHIGFPAALFASADGRVLAYAASTCGATGEAGGLLPAGHGDHGWIGVVDLATGKARTWPVQPLKLNALALSPTGRMLAFTYGGPESSMRVLPADAPPGPAAQRSRAVAVIPTGQFSIGFSPAGTAVLAYVGLGPDRGTALVAYDIASGRLLGAVHAWRTYDAGPQGGFSVALSGRYLLVYGFNRRIAMRIDLATGRAAWVPTTSPKFSEFPNAIAY